MFRLNLGSGAQAFEVEGEADRVRNIRPEELVDWPEEMIENIRQYQERLKLSDADMKSLVGETGDSETDDSGTGASEAGNSEADNSEADNSEADQGTFSED